MKDIIIVNPGKLEKAKSAIKKDGPVKLHILADFDRTLIKAFANGERVPSIISILYNENYLTKEYSKKAQELHKKYYPIETNPNIKREEKKKAMKEWWTLHFNLLVKCGLNKSDIEKAVKSKNIKFREGFIDFADFLGKNNIPLLIISSGGLGKESISLCLEKVGKSNNNIHIISNSFEWDKNGRAVAVKQPIIYNMNKDETTIKDFPEIFKNIKDRKNIILIGDSLDDIGMATGFDYDNIIKIGFFNEKTEENLKDYKKVFDVLILNDGPMHYINKLLKELVK